MAEKPLTYHQLVARSWRENVLWTVLVELTYRCNLDCFFCYNDLDLRGTPLTRDEYFRFFDDLRELEVLNLVLTGGEPLAHPDFLALGRRARELGFVVRIKSNGHALRGPLARRIRDEVDPFLVEVSLHGATAETHDRQTRVPGSFERLLSNLEEMLELGLPLRINSTLTAWNEGEMEAMLALADGLGVPLHFDPEVTPRDDGDRSPLAIAPSREAVARAMEIRAEHNRRAGSGTAPPTVGRLADEHAPGSERKHCGAGSSTVTVDPFGNVVPCVQWRLPVGNLHESSIQDIWASSAGLDAVRRESEDVKSFLDDLGPESQTIGFCPGAAALRSGSARRLHGAAAERLEIARQAATDSRPLLPVIR